MEIGRYLLRGELARGGMGVVYRAFDPARGEEVAIKILLAAGHREQVAARRFQRELEALAQLRHPHVVRIHDAGEHEGHPYMVMDLLTGESLQRRLDRAGPLAPREAAGIGRDLASALEQAHAAGVLHRDIKPDNVMLVGGEPVLIDFGLVKALDADRSKLSMSGAFLGTPGYWPPEQVAGKAAQLGPRSDLYSLGATLYAALTGRAPFEGETLVEQAMATLEAPLTPPAIWRPEVDPGLNAIVVRCLARAIDERYPDAWALRADLERYLRGEPPVALGGPAPGRRGLAPTLALALALAIGAGAALAGWRARPAAPPGASPPRDPAGVRADALAAQGRELGEAGQVEEARQAFEAALALDPDHAEGLHGLGTALTKVGEPQRALEVFDRALEVAPAQARTWRNRAALRARLGDLEGALADAVRAVELDVASSDYWQLRASLELALRRREDALRSAQTAVDLEQSDLAYGLLGMVRTQLGDPLGALTAYQRAAALAPNEATHHVEVGRALEALGRLQEALDAYGEALLLAPERLAARRSRADLLTRLERPEEAILDLRRILEARPDDTSTQQRLGELLLRLPEPRLAEGVGLLQAALAREPEHMPTLNNLAIGLARMERYAEAREVIARALALDPDHPTARYNEAHLLFGARELDAAQASCERYLARVPADDPGVGPIRQLLKAIEEARRRGKSLPAEEPGKP